VIYVYRVGPYIYVVDFLSMLPVTPILNIFMIGGDDLYFFFILSIEAYYVQLFTT